MDGKTILVLAKELGISRSPIDRYEEEEVRQYIMKFEKRFSKKGQVGNEIFEVKSSMDNIIKRCKNLANSRSNMEVVTRDLKTKSKYAGVTIDQKYATNKLTWMARIKIGDVECNKKSYIIIANSVSEEQAALEYDYHVRKLHPKGVFICKQPYKKNQFKINFPSYDFSNFKPQREIDYNEVVKSRIKG